KPCVNDNCSITNTTGSIDIICDSFQQHSCDKHFQNDYPDNLPVKTDDIIMKMCELHIFCLINITKTHLTLSIYGFLSLLVESTEFKNSSSINAAKTFYKTCSIDYSMEKSLIQSKVHEMAEELFNGWRMSSDEKQYKDFSENVLKPEHFNLTAYILPLIFQSGRTTFFSVNLTEGYSQGDDRLIHVRFQTIHDLVIFMHIKF
ncbi:uncharacterized protein DC041_0006322, partial [Schistosoma bovis]